MENVKWKKVSALSFQVSVFQSPLLQVSYFPAFLIEFPPTLGGLVNFRHFVAISALTTLKL